MERSERTSKFDESTPIRVNPLKPLWYTRSVDLKKERADVRAKLGKFSHVAAFHGLTACTLFEVTHQKDGDPRDHERWSIIRDRAGFDRAFAKIKVVDDPHEVTDNCVKAEMTYAPEAYVKAWDLVCVEADRLNYVYYFVRESLHLTSHPTADGLAIGVAEFILGARELDLVVYRVVLNCGATRRRIFNLQRMSVLRESHMRHVGSSPSPPVSPGRNADHSRYDTDSDSGSEVLVNLPPAPREVKRVVFIHPGRPQGENVIRPWSSAPVPNKTTVSTDGDTGDD